jgi:hypothetical protein
MRWLLESASAYRRYDLIMMCVVPNGSMLFVSPQARAAAYHMLNESGVVHHGKIDRRWQRWVILVDFVVSVACPVRG